jgi:hypothetical protein
MHLETLKQKLNLTPDQFGQFDSLEQFQIDHLSALPACEQALIGELWRATKEVRETNFRGTVEDRFKALRDLRVVQWKKAILSGINPHPPHEKLSEETIESFKAGLSEERVDFQFWMTDANGERCLGEMVFVASREVVLARREARRLRGG